MAEFVTGLDLEEELYPEQLSCVLVTLILLPKVGHDGLERSNDFLKVTHLE